MTRAFILCAIMFGCNKPMDEKMALADVAKSNIEDKISLQADKLRDFIKSRKNYNSHIVFLADMSIKSGSYRFFVYDLEKNEVVDKGLVAHGSGSETGTDRLHFSNVNNSNCTSLGKYSIGKSYDGRFGKAYKLYGLDKTNDLAFARNIVLHKYERVPYGEQPDPICNSLGCPMVNEIFYGRLEKIIDGSDKEILLSIYE